MYKGNKPYSGGSSRFVGKVFCHIQAYFCHKSLGTTVKLEVVGKPYKMRSKMYTPNDMDYALSSFNCEYARDCRKFESLKTDKQMKGKRLLKITSRIIKKDKANVVVYLGHNKKGMYVAHGVATRGAVCDRLMDSLKMNVNEARTWKDTNMLGDLLAHEIGHNLGMHHDFASEPRDRKRRCDCKGVMSYDHLCRSKVPAQWSSCSRDDFKNHYDKMVRQNGKWCLRSKFF